MQTVKSTCCYCGVGCGVLISTEAGRIVDVKGDPDHPANFGRLCTKGSTLHLTALPDARLLAPQRRASRDEPLLPASWDDTLEQLADQFAETILAHGPDSVGFYISGQLLTEDYYVFNKAGQGADRQTNNVDTNSRLCMSSAVAAYKATLGADAPPCCYEDFDHADTLLIAGANPAWAHPVAFRRIEEAKKARRPGMKIVVVDPRRTDTAAMADLHLAILPGTDICCSTPCCTCCCATGMADEGLDRRPHRGLRGLRAHVRG
jgi:assimilatory nitrate reductase catalytic subunit